VIAVITVVLGLVELSACSLWYGAQAAARAVLSIFVILTVSFDLYNIKAWIYICLIFENFNKIFVSRFNAATTITFSKSQFEVSFFAL
jgi:hypothetical protein